MKETFHKKQILLLNSTYHDDALSFTQLYLLYTYTNKYVTQE